jgi:hypothetical protein
MDKQFARILMLSILLPAGVTLAQAIDHDRTHAAEPSQDLAPQFADDSSAGAQRKDSIEGRRFLRVIAAEEDAAHHGGVMRGK